jgi:integrase
MRALAAEAAQGSRRWPAILAAAVRAEFDVERYWPGPDDPALGRMSCRVPGCEGQTKARGICDAHHRAWTAAGKGDLDVFVADASPATRQPRRPRNGFDLSGLAGTTRREVAYVLQCRHDERGASITPREVGHLTAAVRAGGVASILDRPIGRWLADLAATAAPHASHERALWRYAYARLEDLAADGDADVVYGRDVWDARRLGLEAHRSPHRINFTPINPAWLRHAAKRWARFRLATGTRFSSVSGDIGALRVFAAFLAARPGRAGNEAAITRAVIEDYLLSLASSGRAPATRTGVLVALKIFLDHSRRHGLLPRLPAGAVVYPEDLPRRENPVPRFINEYLMGQLEPDTAIAHLPDVSTRHLVVVLIETGLRAGDACMLAFDPIIGDSTGWPCLRFHNSKVLAEQLVPLSERAAAASAAQQPHVRSRFPAGSPLLFPRQRANAEGTRPYPTATLQQALRRWTRLVDLRDEAGEPVTITAHRFRHTLGTRMINQNVPAHIVQRYLGHASPAMTARYAHLHDQTLRDAFDQYSKSRVNIIGELLGYDADSPATDAEWIKHNLARVADSLPNGYCGRPPQRECPHPNACLTCPDFQTTPEFLTVHRAQAETNRTLIATAENDGRFRQVTNLRRVQDTLDAIIPALEALHRNDPDRAS